MVSYLTLLAATVIAEPTVTTAISGCQPAQTLEIERLLEVELTGRPESPPTALTITCSPSSIQMTAAQTLTSRARELDPATSERTIALAAIELIDTLAEPPPQQSVNPPRAAAPRPQWLLSLSPAAGVTHAPGALAYGGFAGADARLTDAVPQLSVHVDLMGLRTERDLSPGKATLTLLGIGAAIDWRSNGPQWRWLAGAGFRGGPALVSSRSEVEGVTSRSAARAWLGPFVHARIERSVSDHVVVLVGAEAGSMMRTIDLRVDDVAEATLNGAWVLGTIGLGLAL